jgi:hydrogenase maturation protease
LLHTLVSAHTILGVQDGAFVSLLDPPECWRDYATDCRNIGVWPVLVGAEGQADTMLSSRIILYDYPQVAPESPGDFFDNTEIDEMLTLRILTLTDEEKRAMATVDEQARRLLERTESMTEEQLRGLHGAIRDFQLLLREEENG